MCVTIKKSGCEKFEWFGLGKYMNLASWQLFVHQEELTWGDNKVKCWWEGKQMNWEECEVDERQDMTCDQMAEK